MTNEPEVATAEARAIVARMTPGEWWFDDQPAGVIGSHAGWLFEATWMGPNWANDQAGIAYLKNNALRWLDALDALQGAGEREKLKPRDWREAASCVRNIASRIGVARLPESTKEELDALANQWEVWSKIPDAALAPAAPAPASVPVEVAQAARFVKSSSYLGGQYFAASKTLARYVQSLITPVDDGLPVDEAWLRSVGFSKDEYGLKIRSASYGDMENHCRHAQLYRRVLDGAWHANGLGCPTPQTRGDVRRFCQCLGIPLTDTAGGER